MQFGDLDMRRCGTRRTHIGNVSPLSEPKIARLKWGLVPVAHEELTRSYLARLGRFEASAVVE